MFNFRANAKRRGLFGGGAIPDDPERDERFSSIAEIGQKFEPQQQEQPRGLLGGLRQRVLGERDGTSFQDRVMMAGMALQGDGRGAASYRQGLQEQQTTDAERARQLGEQARAAEQERQRLDGQARALGMDPAEFSMLPPEVQSDLFARQYTPEEPDRPNSYEEHLLAQQDPAYAAHLQSNPRGTSVNVNTGAQPDPRPAIGSIPQGFQARFDEQAGSYVYEPIPGSDPELDRQGVENAAQEAATRQERYAGIALDEIRRATDVLDQNPRAGGAMGQVMQHLGGTLSNELDGLYETIGGYIARDTLQGMRDSSPTGGALGQVTERELAMLRAAYGAIRVSDRPETQLYNLARLNNLLLDVTHGEGVGPPRMELPGREQAGGDEQAGGEKLTEEERRELQELERRLGGR